MLIKCIVKMSVLGAVQVIYIYIYINITKIYVGYYCNPNLIYN